MSVGEDHAIFHGGASAISRGRGLKIDRKPPFRSLSLECPPKTTEDSGPGGILSGEICPADEKFLATRLNDITSYFFLWFCKKYRIRIGPPRDLGGGEEARTKCPICLDACTNSIELQCGHSFCRSCLTRSAANNMTSCALCRREQEINPKLLRARFDEQRMLNLAQRLSIPPPVCSRPPASAPSAVSVSSSEGLREEKEEHLGAGATPQTSGPETLGYGGDVGATSAEDLRRRWKCNGLHAPAVTSIATVGAKSAAELRASWHTLEHASQLTSNVECGSGTSDTSHILSCSATDVEVCTTGRRSPVADLNSSGAGEASQDQLNVRWTHLPRTPLARKNSEGNRGSTHQHSGTPPRSDSHLAPVDGHPVCSKEMLLLDRPDVGGDSASRLRMRWHEAATPTDVGNMESKHLFTRLTHALGNVEDAGLWGAAGLQERWQGAKTDIDKKNNHLVKVPVGPTHGRSSGDKGGLDSSCLRPRWHEAVEVSDVGALGRIGALRSTDDEGGSVTQCYLREQWPEKIKVSDVGEDEVSDFWSGLTRGPGGGEDVGGLSAFSLQTRWQDASKATDVGEVETKELEGIFPQALDDRSVGGMRTADLETRWRMNFEEGRGDFGRGRTRAAGLPGAQNARTERRGHVSGSNAASHPSALHVEAVEAGGPGALMSRWGAAGEKAAPLS